jgi:hypothetical protein
MRATEKAEKPAAFERTFIPPEWHAGRSDTSEPLN